MKTYSRIYDCFRWICINSFRGLAAAGMVFGFFMRLLAPRKYRSFSKAFDRYLEKAHISCPHFSNKMACLACHFIYGSSVNEFFLYHFAELNHRGRKKYITEINRYRLYAAFNGAKKRIEMQSKYRAYQAFQKYYKRKVLYIGKDTPEEEVRAFFAEWDRGILKPDKEGMGKGVEAVRLSDFGSTEEAVRYVLSKKDHVLEEPVRQTGLMRELHPQSVNTVRIYAVRLKDRIEIFGSHLRSGRGESVVDNAGQGGVVVSITNEGLSWTSGIDEFCGTFYRHPDTGVLIPGMVMPEWDKAVALVKEAMDVYPDIRFVGWDVAYTEKGWIIIEANDNGQFHGAQIPHHRGFWDQMQQYMTEL
ncbi:MAG: hypothetical protein J5493_06980 [Lachnospiraceae bacterium]|nr:hypothetical protein [Lachnospiraceae bacterium]